MISAVINKTPSLWLSDLGFSQKKIDEIIASFKPGSQINVCRFSAPHEFWRAQGRSSPNPIFASNYWADAVALADAYGRAGVFEGWLNDEEIKRIAKTHYRDITAISHNWNDLEDDSFWRIKLQGLENVEGIAGPTAEQPTHQAEPRKGISASTSILKGGAVQVFLNPKTPFICTPINW